MHSEAGKQEREEKLGREEKQARSDGIQHSNGISNTMWAMATMEFAEDKNRKAPAAAAKAAGCVLREADGRASSDGIQNSNAP